MKTITIDPVTGDAAVDIALDTIRIGKQALCFVNSKRSAESLAEKIGKKHGAQKECKPLSEQVLAVLSTPTKQCRRLAHCIERGTAFHHAGLATKQREIVEDAFREGTLRIVASTPTLAAGINLPAFRTIIRDLKRFSGAGMTAIPVLEYHQMAGRSGRPDFNDDYGEAIVIAKNDKDAEQITDQYLYGEPEAIWSKVAAQPVLRTYCLSLVASEFVTNAEDLKGFFSETFFAHQYQDVAGIRRKIDETIEQLREWGFIEGQASRVDDFSSADDLLKETEGDLKATLIGRRVSELYIDPLSANSIINGMKRGHGYEPELFAWVQLVCTVPEMRPLMRIKVTDYEVLQEYLKPKRERLLALEPSVYDPDFEGYLEATKTARMLERWAQEAGEDDLLEEFDVRPGELRARLDIADWLIYAAAELARLLKMHHHVAPLQRARTRLKYGVSEELIPLLKFKNIGRVRARTLFRNGIRTAGDVKEADANSLSQLLGPAVAKDLKKQVGQDVDKVALAPKKRKGQLSLDAPRFNR